MKPRESHGTGAADPVAIGYAPRQPGRRGPLPLWVRRTLWIGGGALVAFVLLTVIGSATGAISYCNSGEFCLRCFAESQVKELELFGWKLKWGRVTTENPISKVIHECEGAPCTHVWRQVHGSPRGLLWKMKCDYATPAGYMEARESPAVLSEEIRRRCRSDPMFLDQLRAATAHDDDLFWSELWLSATRSNTANRAP